MPVDSPGPVWVDQDLALGSGTGADPATWAGHICATHLHGTDLTSPI